MRERLPSSTSKSLRRLSHEKANGITLWIRVALNNCVNICSSKPGGTPRADSSSNPVPELSSEKYRPQENASYGHEKMNKNKYVYIQRYLWLEAKSISGWRQGFGRSFRIPEDHLTSRNVYVGAVRQNREIVCYQAPRMCVEPAYCRKYSVNCTRSRLGFHNGNSDRACQGCGGKDILPACPIPPPKPPLEDKKKTYHCIYFFPCYFYLSTHVFAARCPKHACRIHTGWKHQQHARWLTRLCLMVIVGDDLYPENYKRGRKLQKTQSTMYI